MKITFVKKILASGEPCAKCADVEARLQSGGHLAAIQETLVADERDPQSAGMQLAARLQVDRAPFFLVQHPDGREQVYTVYFKFLKEVLQGQSKGSDEAKEILRDNPDLDFI